MGCVMRLINVGGGEFDLDSAAAAVLVELGMKKGEDAARQCECGPSGDLITKRARWDRTSRGIERRLFCLLT